MVRQNPYKESCIERMKELAQNMGAAFGRLITETMVPIITRVLNIMDEEVVMKFELREGKASDFYDKDSEDQQAQSA